MIHVPSHMLGQLTAHLSESCNCAPERRCAVKSAVDLFAGKQEPLNDKLDKLQPGDIPDVSGLSAIRRGFG